MTDKQFTALLQRTARAYNKYKPLLDAAEKEYERRYGDNPSNRDDDSWIDALHGGNGLCKESLTAAEVHESAVLRVPSEWEHWDNHT
jgi:hypothetical protein